MSDSANSEILPVLDAGSQVLKAGFRKALEEAVIEEATHYFLSYPDSLRSLLTHGTEGVAMMSDRALLDYALNSINVGEVGGHSLAVLASQMDEIAARDDLEYRVVWELDIHAVSPAHAARRARDIMRTAASTANVFEVRNQAIPEEVAQIDLQQLDEERDDLVAARNEAVAVEHAGP